LPKAFVTALSIGWTAGFKAGSSLNKRTFTLDRAVLPFNTSLAEIAYFLFFLFCSFAAFSLSSSAFLAAANLFCSFSQAVSL
jgi:hypothetical protein